jgi:hypothetical protein
MALGAAGGEGAGCQQNAKADNILKTKDLESRFRSAKAENILKTRQLLEKRR